MADTLSVNTIDWPSELYERRGAPDHLCGLRVFYDFPWASVFANSRAQFRNGRTLARYVVSQCPGERTPALLLTQLDEQEGWREHDQYYLIVVNITRYQAGASANTAAGYFARAIDPRTAATLPAMTPEQRESLILASLSPDLLRAWLNADPERVSRLADLLREFDTGLRATVSGREPEAARALVGLLGDGAWTALADAGADLPAVLAHRRVWQERRAQCEEFEQHLNAGDWTEGDWQRFFEQRTWIFGYGLRYQFLHTAQERPYVGGRGVARVDGQESDFLMATVASVRFTVLVEIKKPDTPLVIDRAYRNRIYPPSAELVGGVTQLQQACWRWAVDGSRTDAARDQLERDQHIYTHEPRGILVVGNLADIANDRDKFGSFESFRGNLRQPELLTFDELLERAKQIVASGEEAALGIGGEVEVEPMDDMSFDPDRPFAART